jgi:hypothetical protein
MTLTTGITARHTELVDRRPCGMPSRSLADDESVLFRHQFFGSTASYVRK